MRRPKVVNGIQIIDQNRFSVFVPEWDEAGLAELRTWERWFYATGISSVIVLTHRGWAVYRLGLDHEY